MAPRRHLFLLADLTTNVAVEIAGRLATTSERPMDDLCSLRVSCHLMRRVCGEPQVGRCVALERFADEMAWQNPDGYDTLLVHLTEIGNLEACFLTGIEVAFRKGTPLARACTIKLERTAERGHNVAAYVAAILLYRANDGAVNDNAARLYMRQVESKEEVVAAAAAAVDLSFATTGVYCTTGRAAHLANALAPDLRISGAAGRWCRAAIFRAQGSMCGRPVNPWQP
ncbi:hypothetical protein C2845_PM08G10500 [Panicum miliaceum]|uniref:F-box protein n=1 Tax=Panicum miliaceum TaxID=4540 RepID=A0A3L6QXY2_PANMI|nr:hypothetical protein C2845_PM08G10500 [Panicum miliaceum]